MDHSLLWQLSQSREPSPVTATRVPPAPSLPPPILRKAPSARHALHPRRADGGPQEMQASTRLCRARPDTTVHWALPWIMQTLVLPARTRQARF